METTIQPKCVIKRFCEDDFAKFKLFFMQCIVQICRLFVCFHENAIGAHKPHTFFDKIATKTITAITNNDELKQRYKSDL